MLPRWLRILESVPSFFLRGSKSGWITDGGSGPRAAARDDCVVGKDWGVCRGSWGFMEERWREAREVGGQDHWYMLD